MIADMMSYNSTKNLDSNSEYKSEVFINNRYLKLVSREIFRSTFKSISELFN